ncbi:hypothetical protein B0T20DRAFT_360859 [Sordaria brevicollis]|uniref:PHD-type domain-containing protein n=1 Tax=Sordaria brevicollis TaxID=83679 RepID=A0AAE0U6P7_SORBR|nr:hypothetical protein B0T20DRAFT_360859 [Sordaria brevicollis]
MTSRCRRYRQLPFLHRTWIRATNYWENRMGNKPSTQSRVPAHESDVRFVDHNQQSDQDFDDACRHPAKRRRLSSNDSFPLYEDPDGETPRSLRIDVLKIIHKDSPRVKNGGSKGTGAPIASMQARCKLSIYGHNGDEKVLLHADSKLCGLRISKNPTAASTHMARLCDIKAFNIPEDKIYLERNGDDPAFGFADSYSLQIEIESAGDPSWPPSTLFPAQVEEDPSVRTLPPRQWALSADIPDIFRMRNRKSAKLKARMQQSRDTPTDYLADVDVRWSTGISSQLTGNQKPKEIMPSITVIDPWAPKKPLSELPVNGTNGINGRLHDPMTSIEAGKAAHWEDNGTHTTDARGEMVEGNLTPRSKRHRELVEGDLTPNRSKRQRTDINYNVRQLLNTQLGRSPRKRQRDGEEQPVLDEHTVTYVLPPDTLGPNEEPIQVSCKKLCCLVCGAEHDRISQLRAHFSCHPDYVFNFEQKRGMYVVEVRSLPEFPPKSSSSPWDTPKPYNLGLPLKQLDLTKYVNGDDSWVTSRLLPDSPVRASSKPSAPPRLTRSPTKVSQQQQKEKSSSAGTSTRGRAAATTKPPQKKKKPVFVPTNINRPLYDPLSKVELKPGSEVRYPALDEGWLITKHADALGEFSDVEPHEKEYMMKWDAYILQKHLCSEQYLPREFRNFVKINARWLVEKKYRAEEMGKHMAILLARGYVDDATVLAVMRELNESRKAMASAAASGSGSGSAQARGQAEGQEQQPEVEKKRIAAGGCAKCGEVVSQPEMMICCNKNCKHRLHHRHCVSNQQQAVELARKRKWKCPQCEPSEAAPNVGH